jgi:cbb3-type cytochrome oxidase maturation protein
MEIVFVLVAIGGAFAAAVVGVLAWAVRSGQFDDLEGPAHRILIDEESIVVPEDPGAERTAAAPGARRT